MMKSAILSEFYPPTTGGIQHALASQASWFGSDLTVLAPPADGAAAFDSQQSYRIVRRSLFSGRRWPHWWWLIRWIRQAQQQGTKFFIFGHYSRAVTAGWLAHIFFGVRYAIYTYGNDLLQEIRHPIWRFLVARQLRAAEWVNVTGPFMANRVYALGVRRYRIISTIPVMGPAGEARSSAPSAGPTLLTVCRLVPRKNVLAVLRAVADLRNDFPDIHYDIVGDGPQREELQAMAGRLGIAGHVTFHGRIAEAAKEQLLARATVGILVPQELDQGTDVEGFGIFFLEAARHGKPVIASRSGGVADAVIDEQTGVLVNPDDRPALAAAIAELFRDQQKRVRYGQRAQQMVNEKYIDAVQRPKFLAAWPNDSPESRAMISVIIPAFNSAATIGRALESIYRQTWKAMEVIVVDDGSTDSILQAIAPWKDKLTYLRQDNQGAPVGRNRGAHLAHGQFLLFCDADVVLRPNALAAMAMALQTRPHISFAYSNFRFGPKNFHPGEYDQERLKKMNYIHTTSLIRREHFPGFDPTLKKFQDWDVWLTMAEQGHVGIWIAERLYTVQQRQGGISSWLPSFLYQLPLIGQGKGSQAIKKYRQGEEMIRKKHHLDSCAAS